MDISVKLNNLRGEIDVIPSKSYAHRAIIAAALSDSPTEISSGVFSEDIKATVRCITALGASVNETEKGLIINPSKERKEGPELFAGESGTTARLILPVASVTSDKATLTGSGRLPERPMNELTNVLSKHGVSFSSEHIPLTITGNPTPGIYEINGNISSQYISGLLYALPLLSSQSEIKLLTPLESEGYVDMTISVLKEFGISISKTEKGYIIPSQKYISPGSFKVEADWSNAAFFVVLNELGSDIKINNLNLSSLQGDRKITELLNETYIDASQIPDLVPVLSVLACKRNKDTVIYNAKRLRIKESDRLKTVNKALTDIGAHIEEKDDGLIIHGKGYLRGGTADGFNDHRIVMSLAVASAICENPVIIKGAEAVSKSYPDFFTELKKLGGNINELHNG